MTHTGMDNLMDDSFDDSMDSSVNSSMEETDNQIDILGQRSAVLNQSADWAGQESQTDTPLFEDEQWQERESRNELRHIAGITSSDEESEIEYRKVRLERVVLVGIWSNYDSTLEQAEESLRELSALAQTAGAQVVDGVLQHRSHPDAATFVGSGKAREIANIVAANDADTIIVDADLAPSQRRGLEDVAKVKVVDRTAVILDIFAQHATSKEGKAQVELAQLEYMLPRLRGWGASLSRQAGGQAAGQDGGIGSRGPGETQLELDRRVIRTRMAKLRKKIAKMQPQRAIKRASRTRSSIPTVAIVGYTNAGKSSLTNRLSGSVELVGNALFATLDTAVRRVKLPHGRQCNVIDTVGFVRRLPTQLVEAFKSTLEEVELADVIVHVVDGTYPQPEQQIKAVDDILAQLDGVSAIPQLLVFNKVDAATELTLDRLRNAHPDSVLVSAKEGQGIEELLTRIEQLLPMPHIEIEATIPYQYGSLVSRAQDLGSLDRIQWLAQGIAIHGFVDESLATQLLRVAIE